MSTRTTAVLGRVRPVIDENSVLRSGGGRQIDWANVNASYAVGQADGKKFIPAWTVMGELLGAGKLSPRVVTTNPATGFLESDAKEGAPHEALSGYGFVIGASLYENLLPDSSGGPPRVLASAIKTELGTDRWYFEQYGDAR